MWRKDVYDDGKYEMLTLKLEDYNRVKQWAYDNLVPTGCVQEWAVSPVIQGLIQRQLNIYVSNADVKKILNELGFIHRPIGRTLNWRFNISKKSLKGM